MHDRRDPNSQEGIKMELKPLSFIVNAQRVFHVKRALTFRHGPFDILGGLGYFGKKIPCPDFDKKK